jgi:hypothetical protein
VENKPVVNERGTYRFFVRLVVTIHASIETRLNIKGYNGVSIPEAQLRPPLAPRSIHAPPRVSLGGTSFIPQLHGFGYHSGAPSHSDKGPDQLSQSSAKLVSTEHVDLEEKVCL